MAQTYEDKPTLAAWNAAEGAGNCKIVTGTYIGDGKSGSENPVTLTFDAKPVLVVLRPQNSNTGGNSDSKLVAVRDSNWAMVWPENKNTIVNITWGSNYVSWYGTSGSASMFNDSYRYRYVAFLSTDE